MTASAAVAEPPQAFSLGRRVMILVAVMLGSTLYATTLLIASTLLPPATERGNAAQNCPHGANRDEASRKRS